jgi:hypothetical protein
MKKILTILFFASLAISASARPFSITNNFKFWLLNNEARMLSTISFDRQIAARINHPLVLIPVKASQSVSPIEKILVIHRKFYQLLDEIDEIYNLAKRFGNGRFSVVIKQARPEIWATIPFDQQFVGMHRHLAGHFRQAFYNTLIKALELDQQRDKDLSARLSKASSKLSDEESRLFNGYLETFSALYPSDKSGKMILAFIESGTRRQFALGIERLLEPELISTQIQVAQPLPAETSFDDPLAELEKLTAMSESENVQITLDESENAQDEGQTEENASEMNESTEEDPGESQDKPQDEGQEIDLQDEQPADEPGEDMFNIWD